MEENIVEYANRVKAISDDFIARFYETFDAIDRVISKIHASWSGSNIGYHAFVYYENLKTRPPGALFSSEWGLMDTSLMSYGTVGDWEEYSEEYVIGSILSKAGNPDLTTPERESRIIRSVAVDFRDRLISELTIQLSKIDDSFLQNLKDTISKIPIPAWNDIKVSMLPKKYTSRDSDAMHSGLHLAPHQKIAVDIIAMRIPADVISELHGIAMKANSHFRRLESKMSSQENIGTNVVIGHGRSPLWRELKEFVQDRLRLPVDEFNQVPIAGLTNIQRLTQMLDSAAFALIVMTAEDDMADGSRQARMNVIHEVGLFQGKLGFSRAIVLLEEGCEEFSNIEGLGQVRFPAGNISAVFENIRAVLEREGLI